MMEGVEEVTILVTTTNVNIALLNETELTKYLPVTIILVIIMCVGIVGNLTVIYIYMCKFKRSSARVYILSLALADLTVCMFGIPYHVLDLTLILTYSNKYLCKVFSYFIGAFTFSSIFILLVVGIDRYLKVCRPLKKQIIDFGDRKACIIAVFVAMVISVPNGIIYGHSSVHTGVNNITGVECFIDDEYQGSSFVFGYLIFNMFIFLASIVILIIIYALICHTIYSNDWIEEITLHNRHNVCSCIKSNDDGEDLEMEELEKINVGSKCVNVADGVQKNIQEPLKKKSSLTKEPYARRRETLVRHAGRGERKEREINTKKITLMMMTITIVFIISYLPFMIISIMDNLDEAYWDELTESRAILLDLLLRLYLINNAANPIIYSFWDFRFRKKAALLYSNLFCCLKKSMKEEHKRKSKHSTYSCSTKVTGTVVS